MKLLTVGRFTEKLNYRSNFQDFTTWSAMAKWFDEVFIVVESPDVDFHTETIDNLRIYWIGKRYSFFSRVLFMLDAYLLCKQLIIINKIDVINVSEPVVAGPVGVVLKWETRIPLVTQVQGQLFNLPPKTFSFLKSHYIRFMSHFTCKHSNRVRTVSNEIAESVIESGVPKEKVFVIPSRCDTTIFNPEKYTFNRFNERLKLGYSSKDIVIIFTGRIVKYRDLESDLLALHELIKSNKSYQLLIVGDGADKARLESLSKNLNLSGHVKFYGRVPFEEIPRLLSLADIFISTPTNEAIARSVLEAMAMELPVVATKVGGTPEVITHGVNGFLVDVKSPEQIVSCIQLVSSDLVMLKEIGIRARMRVLEEFEFNHSIRRFAELHLNLN